MAELVINSIDVGNYCPWYNSTKMLGVENKPVVGIWEPSAEWDDRSPNVWYKVVFVVIFIATTPGALHTLISELRDTIGEGPFTAVWDNSVDAPVDFSNLRWMESPEPPSEDGIAGTQLELVFQTGDKPVPRET